MVTDDTKQNFGRIYDLCVYVLFSAFKKNISIVQSFCVRAPILLTSVLGIYCFSLFFFSCRY